MAVNTHNYTTSHIIVQKTRKACNERVRDSIKHDTPEHAAHNPGSLGQSVVLTVFSEMSVSAATPGPTSSSVSGTFGVSVPYSSYAP